MVGMRRELWTVGTGSRTDQSVLLIRGIAAVEVLEKDWLVFLRENCAESILKRNGSCADDDQDLVVRGGRAWCRRECWTRRSSNEGTEDSEEMLFSENRPG